MSLNNVSINKIDMQDIKNLIKDQEPESKHLEYKGEMEGQEEKRAINKAVCGFANADGGLFIYGINEDENKKHTLINGISLDGTSLDEKKRSILSTIEANIEPRVDVGIKGIELDDDKVVILIKVPKSWNAPHCIKKNNGKIRSFYIRRDGSTNPMEFEEIKNMFDLNGKLHEKINSYRDERVQNITSKNESNYNVIFHAIPFDAFSKSRIDFRKARIALRGKEFLSGFYFSDFDGLWGDGYLFKKKLFRNGIFEAFYNEHDYDVVYVHDSKDKFEKFVTECLEVYEELNISCPVVFFVTFTNIKGLEMAVNPPKRSKNRDPERDILDPAGIIIKEKDQVKSEVYNVFVPIYNHYGFEVDYDFEQSEIE